MFDLKLTVDFAMEQALRIEERSPDVLAVDLNCGFVICFANSQAENDTCIYFDGSTGGWHTHGDLFIEEGVGIELVPIEILQGLMNGKMLVSKIEFPDGTVDISLEHSYTKFDLGSIENGEIQTFARMKTA
ncbi:MAG: hypothetical protein HN350_07190 [Phycisphaerales bacterium]|jgi:hypothetical protein|nr:hypothetical protein [Phycisphaerales bacterium]